MPRYKAAIEGANSFTAYEKVITDTFEKATRETIKEFAERVRKDAIRNIEIGQRSSRYPQTGALANSIKYSVRGGSVSFQVGDANTPYARLQDDPNPTIIVPNGKSLTFFFHRIGAVRSYKSVIRKGNLYFGRAWVANLDVLQAIMDKKLSEGEATNIRSAASGSGKRYYSLRDERGRFTRQVGR